MMVFDWIKAAKLIKEHKVEYAEAGLQLDMEYTSGPIFNDGKPTDGSGCYLASTWATLVIVINGNEIECYRMEGDLPGWGSDTIWPPEAIAELNTIDAEQDIKKIAY